MSKEKVKKLLWLSNGVDLASRSTEFSMSKFRISGIWSSRYALWWLRVCSLHRNWAKKSFLLYDDCICGLGRSCGEKKPLCTCQGWRDQDLPNCADRASQAPCRSWLPCSTWHENMTNLIWRKPTAKATTWRGFAFVGARASIVYQLSCVLVHVTIEAISDPSIWQQDGIGSNTVLSVDRRCMCPTRTGSAQTDRLLLRIESRTTSQKRARTLADPSCSALTQRPNWKLPCVILADTATYSKSSPYEEE